VDRSLNKHIDAAIEGRIRNIVYDRTITVAEPIDRSVDIDRAFSAVNLPNCSAQSPLWVSHAVYAVVGSGLVSREQNMRSRVARGGNVVVGVGTGATQDRESRVGRLRPRPVARHRIACSCPHRFDVAYIQKAMTSP
jgi:hypothetical protein